MIPAVVAQRRGSAGRARDSTSAMRRSDFGGTGLVRCSPLRSERSEWLCYLWRAVDHEGEVLEAEVTAKPDKAAARKLLKRMMKKFGRPRTIVTDGLRAHSAATKEVGNADRQEVGGRLNNRAGTRISRFDDESLPCSTFEV